MLEKFTKKIVNQAKDTVKDEVSKSMNKNLPLIFGLVTVGLTIFSRFGPTKPKAQTITIINNYYIYK